VFYLDTSFLVPYFVPEKASRPVEKFLSSLKTEELAISQWTRTEFVSALGIKIRTQRFSENAARRALAAFDEIAGQYFTVIQIMERDYLLAAEFLSQWSLGLRAGDALHLALAKNHGAKRIYSLDKSLVKAASRLRIPAGTGIKI